MTASPAPGFDCPIAFVPLDDRPCTARLPVQLAALVDQPIVPAPKELLGAFLTPGNPAGLARWLLDTAPHSSALLVSSEMLVFGGLIASRRHDLSAPEALARLRGLRAIVAAAPGAPVDMLSALMRTAPTFTAAKDLRLAAKISKYSQLCWTLTHVGGAAVTKALARAKAALPAAALEEYLAARARNHLVNRTLVEWAGEGLVATLFIGQDDVTVRGLNLQERVALEALVEERRLSHQVWITSGTDELAAVALTRRLVRHAGWAPKVAVRYSRPPGAAQRLRYEDCGLEELIDRHIAAIGARRVDDAAAADLVLAVHSPKGHQREAAVQVPSPKIDRGAASLIHAIAGWLSAGQPVALADVAYANGADRAFTRRVLAAIPAPCLSAYAAWNTAGNTLGTALAHGILRTLALRSLAEGAWGDDAPAAARRLEEAHQSLLLERFVDDYLYQSRVRQQVGVKAAARRINTFDLGVHAARVESQVAAGLGRAADALYRSAWAGRTVTAPMGSQRLSWKLAPACGWTIRLPWPRLFEVDVRAVVGLEANVLSHY